MVTTRTGKYVIGFRRMGSAWQQDIERLLPWAKDHGFGAIDLQRNADQLITKVVAAGLRVGSVDLAEWQGMISPDRAKRTAAVTRNAEYIRQCAVVGPVNHFLVMLPERPDLKSAENFGYMVESFSELAPVLEKNSARLVIEGWPGPGALVCTPEGYRTFFAKCPSMAMGVNYDPSHLLRMGICPLRFLREFGARVYHVHGKDTELLAEGLYEHGNTLPRLFGENQRFGSTYWRYTIPGHGQVRWIEVFRALQTAGYRGCVSIEMEDGNFNGSEDGEKQGLLLAQNFLSGC